jgi:dCMP deaminase
MKTARRKSRTEVREASVARGPGSTSGPRAAGTPQRVIGPRHRVDWHTYFMNIATQVATRSTCDRKHVGAVIVRDKTILSTGYNGSIRGMPHCDEVGHDLENDHCVATIHAEANAILQAAKNGVMIDGAELYTTASPCWSCFKLIANAGIGTIYYGEFYRDRKSLAIARRLKIDLIDLGEAARKAARKEEAGCDWKAPRD